jgi:hypothetical protein
LKCNCEHKEAGYHYLLEDDTTHVNVKTEFGCIGCFADRHETTSDLDDEGALSGLVERIGKGGMGKRLHDVEADEYYPHL